jgi:hypothetical protein
VAVRGFAAFAVAALVLISAAVWVLGLVYATPAEHRAIQVGAVVAYVVQLLTFGIARLSMRRNVIAGWGVGVGVRLITLGVFALLVVRALGLVSTAPLFLFVCLFVTMLVEPLFLKL